MKTLTEILEYVWQASPHNKDRIIGEARQAINEILEGVVKKDKRKYFSERNGFDKRTFTDGYNQAKAEIKSRIAQIIK